MKIILLAVAIVSLTPTLTLADDAMKHTGEMGDLPAICTANAPTEMPHMMGGEGPDLDAAHAELNRSMDGMHEAMSIGMSATDLDVAFVCGMIPHHRGAIAMAKAELEHGDDPFARTLAEAIIVAQEAEIAEMLAWLATQN